MKNISINKFDAYAMEKQLEEIQVPTLKASAYESQLEKKLMQSSHWEKQSLRSDDQEKTRFSDFLLKGGEYTMKHKIMAFGATGFAIAIVAVGIFALGGNSFSSIEPKQAQAQEIINKSFDKVSKLSPEEQKELGRSPEYLEGFLNEARSAKDLEIVPEAEIQRVGVPNKKEKGGQTESKEGQRFSFKNGKFEGKIPAQEDVTILQYTDPHGASVILGIDPEDKPVLVLKEGEEINF